LVGLYSLGRSLKAASFNNSLIDAYFELTDIIEGESVPTLQDLVHVYEAGLQTTDLSVLLLAIHVRAAMNNLKHGYATCFAENTAFDKDHVELYFQVMQMTVTSSPSGG